MSNSVYRLWWLNPVWLFAAVTGSTMLTALLQSERMYQQYGTLKYIEGEHFLFALLAIIAFGLGGWIATSSGNSPAPHTSVRMVRFWFWLTFGLCIFGYTVWAGVGIKNGVSFEMLDDLISAADTYAAEETVRKELFPTIPGVTTCTQFGVTAVLLGLWLYIRGDRSVIGPIIVIAGLALIRAFLWRERTALLAFAIPGFAIWLRAYVLVRSPTPLVRVALQLAPVFGVVGLLAFFGIFEYFRSWRIYQGEFDSYAEFILWRVGGYFTTAHNNGAMALEMQRPLPLPYWTLQPLWEFPGMRESSFSYHALTGVDPAAVHVDMLMNYGTVEYNNEGGLFTPFLDYGFLGYLAFWLASGFVAGKLYRSFLAGTLVGLTIYPIAFLTILNSPLIIFVFFPAAFPFVAALLLVAWLANRQPTQATDESAVPLRSPGMTARETVVNGHFSPTRI